MKRCPVCNAVYNDDILIKCTSCGSDLIAETPQASYEQPEQNDAPPQNNYTNYNAYNYSVKYCTRCGNQCDPRAVICVRCGYQFTDMYNPMNKANDKPSGLLKFLCFLLPMLGLILYIMNVHDKPVSAKAYGKSALIGFIIRCVLCIGLVVLFLSSSLLLFGADSVVPAYPESEFFYSMIHSIF
jgi:hypothetical protein